MSDSTHFSRRNFVKTSSFASTAIALGGLSSARLLAADDIATKQLKVGVVGLGGRGSGAVNDILQADPNTVLWATADIFEKTKKTTAGFKQNYGDRISTDNGQREFIGFDAYQKVIDSGVDIVLLTSTPAFRPLHFEAAVSAGKHVFIEKPFALDIPGLKQIIATAQKAKQNGQSVLTGLVWRYSPFLMELHKRIEDGEIGEVLSVSSSYCGGGRPNPMPDPKFKPKTMSDMEWAMRYWQGYVELGGDSILEYMIHGIDRMSWAMGNMMPVKCFGSGANIFPLLGANAFDSFNLRYEYSDGRIANFIGYQLPRTYADSGDHIFGTKGRAVAGGGSAAIFKGGKEVWRSEGGLDYVNEHKILTSHIRQGKVYGDVLEQFDNTHAMCIMGRSAGYTGQLITQEQLMTSTDVLFQAKDIDFSTPFKAREVSQPGITKFS